MAKANNDEYLDELAHTLDELEQNARDVLATIEAAKTRIMAKVQAERALNIARALGQATLERTEIRHAEPGRAPVGERAGTHINARAARRIIVGTHLHGLLDTEKHVYQGGGEANKFIYQKKGWITLDKQVWLQIRDESGLVIEMIDHPTNTVYRIGKTPFATNMREYNAGGNDRVGVALSFWQHLDKDGVVLPPEGGTYAQS